VTRWTLLPYAGGGGGAPGPAGPPGAPGRDGSTIPLLDGKRGSWGFPGPQGDQGAAGAAGAAGAPGAPGAPGGVGATGAAGRDAPPGFDGKRGSWGLPGPPGRDGVNGTNGAAGLAGRDAPPGMDGRPGRWGLPGPQGSTGSQGIQGVQGIQGNPGAVGSQGLSGPPGFDGRPGPSSLVPIMQLVTARDVGGGNTADIVANAVDTYLIGVDLTRALKAGSVVHWLFRMSKTAFGVAAPTFTVRGGVNGSVTDTALVALVLSAQTAIADDGWCDVAAVLRSVGTAAVLSASVNFTHTLATTGLSTTQTKTASGNSAGFDTTQKPLRIGVSCNPGTAGVWTFQLAAVHTANLQPSF
jgi:hypothetical protein